MIHSGNILMTQSVDGLTDSMDFSDFAQTEVKY